MPEDVEQATVLQPGPFVKSSRRPDILSRLTARAASQPAATTAPAIAAQAARPVSAAAKNFLLDVTPTNE